MANTYICLNIHYVFSTKNREPMIDKDVRDRLWAYLGGIAKTNKMKALCIGGTDNHIHALLSIPATISVAKGIQLLKGGSSKWVHETFDHHEKFGWQEGYGAFSVGISQVDDTIAYIHNQEQHHRKRTFKEEYLAFLQKHSIEYNEQYVWN